MHSSVVTRHGMGVDRMARIGIGRARPLRIGIVADGTGLNDQAAVGARAPRQACSAGDGELAKATSVHRQT